MHGNVMQLCSDVYADYPKEGVTDLQGPAAKNDSLRVLRGGCWRNEPVYCRSASRYKPPRPVAASAAASASRLPSDKSRTVYRHQRAVCAIAVPTSFD